MTHAKDRDTAIERSPHSEQSQCTFIPFVLLPTIIHTSPRRTSDFGTVVLRYGRPKILPGNKNWNFNFRKLRCKIQMDTRDDFLPVPQLHAIFKRDASETNFKDPQRLFPGFLCGIPYQRCWSDRYKSIRAMSNRSRRVYSSIHIS